MRFSLLAIVLVGIGVVACSDPVPATPKAFIAAQLGPGNDQGVNDSTKCRLTTQSWLTLGTSTVSIENGTKQSDADVVVSCAVTPEGDGYRVSASATLTPGGTLSVTGLFHKTGTQQNIYASFTRGDTGSFKQSDCTVEYKGGSMGVDAGKVWGVLTCPKEYLSGQDRTCLGTAEFKFENCDK